MVESDQKIIRLETTAPEWVLSNNHFGRPNCEMYTPQIILIATDMGLSKKMVYPSVVSAMSLDGYHRQTYGIGHWVSCRFIQDSWSKISGCTLVLPNLAMENHQVFEGNHGIEVTSMLDFLWQDRDEGEKVSNTRPVLLVAGSRQTDQVDYEIMRGIPLHRILRRWEFWTSPDEIRRTDRASQVWSFSSKVSGVSENTCPTGGWFHLPYPSTSYLYR